MSDEFDPYLFFLQIPPARRPPMPEDLLGLTAGSLDEQGIQQAFRDRYEHVQKYVLSPKAEVREQAQSVIRELAQAVVVLTQQLHTADASGLDPYYLWLGIPPEEQPPNHYRLLGLRLFEENQAVIEAAARRQSVFLKTFLVGQHGKLAVRLLAEVEEASTCLSGGHARAAYDVGLRASLKASAAPAAEDQPKASRPAKDRLRQAEPLSEDEVRAIPRSKGQAPPDGLIPAASPADKTVEAADPFFAAIRQFEPGRPARARRTATRKQSMQLAAVLGLVGVAGSLVVALIVWAVKSDPKPGSDQVVVSESQPPVHTSNQVPSGPPEAKQGVPNPSTKPEGPPSKPSPSGDSGTKQPENPATVPPEPESTPSGTSSTVPEKTEPEKPPSDENTPQPEEEPAKLPAPTSARRQEITLQLNEVYHLGEKRTPAATVDLARKLLELGKQSQQKPDTRFVLLSKAVELAADAGDALLMVEAADAMDEAFEVDCLKIQQTFLDQVGGAATTAEKIQSFVEASEAVIDRAAGEEQYDLALKLATDASRICQKAAGREFRKRVHDRRTQIQQLCDKRQEVLSAQETLKTDPENAKANLALGSWYCFFLDDWEQGLPYLAKSSDAGLKKLAAQELASPTSAEDQVRLADAWWDAGQAAKNEMKHAMLLHASTWYENVQFKLTSTPTVQRVEQRLAEVAKLFPPAQETRGSPPQTAVAPFDTPRAKEYQESWAAYLKTPVVLENSVGGRLTLIPPGEYQRGGGAKTFRVRITRPFYFGTHEVTQAEYTRVMGTNPSEFQGDGRLPLEMVSWDECVEFCRRLSDLPEERAAGRVYRLPTEAEWEYACRAGTVTAFFFGDNGEQLGEYAWFFRNSSPQRHPVGEKKPNPWGLYDILGNVAEWCSDRWGDNYYEQAPVDDPQGPPSGDKRVHRGFPCAYYDNGFYVSGCRHVPVDPAERSPLDGLRLVCMVKPKPAARHGLAAARRTPDVFHKQTLPGDVSLGDLPRGKPVDLLRTMDLNRDCVFGEWRREGTALSVAAKDWFTGGTGSGARIMLPVSIDGSYDLEIEFTRESGSDAAHIIFPVGSSACMLALGSFQDTIIGLGLVDGRDTGDNATTIRPGSLTNGKRYAVQINVRAEAQAATIDVAIDGAPRIHWVGQQSSLSLPSHWALPNADRPALGANWSTVTYHAARLRVVSGRACWTTSDAKSAASSDESPPAQDGKRAARVVKRGNDRVTDGRENTKAAVKEQRAKLAFEKSLLNQLGPTPDGHFLLALEEAAGPKVLGVTFKAVQGRDAAMNEIKQFLAGGDGKSTRSYQVLSRFEPSDRGKGLARSHSQVLQQYIDKRLSEPVFLMQPCHSCLDHTRPADQALAEGTYVIYRPFAGRRLGQ